MKAEVEECAICLQELDLDDDSTLTVELGCIGKHRYHEVCFRTWASTRSKTTPLVTSCPSCRSLVNEVRLLIPSDGTDSGIYSLDTFVSSGGEEWRRQEDPEAPDDEGAAVERCVGMGGVTLFFAAIYSVIGASLLTTSNRA